MTLRAMKARHARKIVRSDHLGESVTYHFAAGGTATFLAGVTRQLVEADSAGVPQVARLRATVSIPRHATAGVLAVVNGDQIELALELGGAATINRIVRKVEEDEGMIRVEVEQ